VLNFEQFWVGIEQNALSENDANEESSHLALLNLLFYSDARTWGEVKEAVLAMSLSSLRNLFDELHYFVPMEADDSEEFEDSNSHQTIMEINRMWGLAQKMRSLKAEAKRRLL